MQLSQLERRFAVDGISNGERMDLQQRMRTVRQQLRAADGGNQARWDRYDREDGYGRDGQYARDDDDRDGRGRYDRDGRDDRIDSNRDGYDDRDLDRDGRWDDDQRDGAYAQPGQRGGVGGVIDAIMNGGGLRVGQRAPDTLYGVPIAYRDQYRDSGSAYYRSDGRQIYQIDARNGAVVRVYPMSR